MTAAIVSSEHFEDRTDIEYSSGHRLASNTALLAAFVGAVAGGPLVTTVVPHAVAHVGLRAPFFGLPARDVEQQVFDFGYVTTDLADEIVTDLARLNDGWAGEGPFAPSAHVIRDVEHVLAELPLSAHAMPDVEVDDDGRTSLFWLDEHGRVLSLNFAGNGRVICLYVDSDTSKCKARTIVAHDAVGLFAFLEEVMLLRIF